jgi:hypothetical protein
LNDPYEDEEDEARFEGSGGASGVPDYNYGGSGGGIVWLSSSN